MTEQQAIARLTSEHRIEGVQDATPRKTMAAREGDPEWLVAYIKRTKHGPTKGQQIFIDAKEAIALFQKQKPGCASLWRRAGSNFVLQEFSPQGKEVATKNG